ncbi:MAG: RNA polymerase sigma factor [Saprospiraceae bacterium]
MQIIETKPLQQKASVQLLRQCINGERQAQQRLYQLYIHQFLNKAYRVVWQKEDAQDVVQDAFLKILSSLGTLKDLNKFEGWAKRIVVNRAISLLRQKGKMPIYDIEETEIADIKTNENDFPEHWDIRKAKNALAKLAPGYRTIISLYLLEGYDHKEISEIMGISVSTSITQYNRGKKRLREVFRKGGRGRQG